MQKKISRSLFMIISLVLVIAICGGSISLAQVEPAESKAPVVKDETVYFMTTADGHIDKIMVSDHLQNTGEYTSISDSSELLDIENMKGSENYIEENNIKIWDAQGKDIYYQGSIEKAAPLDLVISYELDGQKISPEELAGKSGKLIIHFDYLNKQYEKRTIEGKEEKIYVPFVMLTTLVLDNDIFSNVTATNGKILNDGDRQIVTGLSFPGLQHNLGIDASKYEIPSYFEISADVKDFEMSNTLSLATNELFKNIDLDSEEALDNLSSSLDELTDATTQLLDGSFDLYDGLSTLLDKSADLISGIDKANEGALQLKDGSAALKDGAEALSQGGQKLAQGSSDLASGAAELSGGLSGLSAGLGEITANSESLNSGARDVFTALLNLANKQLSAANVPVPTLNMENYAEVLDGLSASLKQGQATDQAQALVEQQVVAISALKQQLDAYQAFYQGLKQYTAAVSSAKEGADSLYAGSERLTAAAEQINAGSQDLKQGTDSLSAGASELYSGMTTLQKGLLNLQTGGKALSDGVTKLKDGSKDLAEGVEEFKDKGIQKLVDAVDGDTNTLLERCQATIEVAQNYQNFTGLADNMEGKVRFIYRTDDIR